MADEFTAYALDGSTTTDADGYEVPGYGEVDLTIGRIPNRRTGGDATNARTVTVGGVEHVVIEGGLHVPWSDSPEVGWEYVLTWAGPRTHPSLLGKRFKVVETHPTSDMTAWRLDVVEV